MALSSSSTYADALAQYNDSLSYEGSSTATANHIAAIRWLFANRASSSADSATSMSFESLNEQLRLAVEHLRAIKRTYRAPFVRGRML